MFPKSSIKVLAGKALQIQTLATKFFKFFPVPFKS